MLKLRLLPSPRLSLSRARLGAVLHGPAGGSVVRSGPAESAATAAAAADRCPGAACWRARAARGRPRRGAAAPAQPAPGYYAAPGYGQPQTPPHAGPGAVPPQQQPYYGYQQPYYQQPYAQPMVTTKDHVAAGLLAIFLGAFGIHKFYLGYNTAGFIMLAVTIIGGVFTFDARGGVMWVIGVIEGILYLTKSQSEFEQTYVVNKREWF